MSGGGNGSAVNQSSGCFNGILRRLLCTASVPTHPSDQIPESNTTQLVYSMKDPNFEPKIQSSAGSVTPGIVARLMGLESLPETNWVSKRMAPDLVKRSRSVSFADYLMGFDLGEDQDRDQQQHRRVKTSVSFREAPAVLNHQKSPDFVVVYLDNTDKAMEVGKKVEKSEVGFGKLKQGKKREQRSKHEKNRESNEVVKKEKIVRIKQNKKIDRLLKDETRRERSALSPLKSKSFRSASYRNGSVNLKKESEHLPVKKAMQKKKVVAKPKMKKKNQENSAAKEKEDRSPVSVLDIDDILIEHEVWLSGYSMPMDLNSKVNSSPKASDNDIQEVIPANRRDFEPIKDESREYAELLAMKIQKWTEEDLKDSNWVAKNAVQHEGLEEICVELEGMILDKLLDQAIDELVVISHDNLWTCYD